VRRPQPLESVGLTRQVGGVIDLAHPAPTPSTDTSDV
jgi:hypothetical protein